MSGHRLERITEDIKRELTAIFRELKDPRITQTMLSIVKVPWMEWKKLTKQF